MFFNKPKKKNYAPMIIAIVVGVLAALATAYVVVTKVLKKPLFPKKAVAEVEGECECECECECEEIAEEACECEAVAEEA